MGHTPQTPIEEPQAHAPERVDAHPEDPETNTRPRGNGEEDRGETQKSSRKLDEVLGH